MGHMTFSPGVLSDSLSETAGYKAGLALSVDDICDHLSGNEYPDIIRDSEKGYVRLSSTRYEDIFYTLLYRIGHTTQKYDGDLTGVNLFHKYRHTPLLQEYLGVLKLFSEMMPLMTEKAASDGTKSIDPRPFMQACYDQFGKIGLDMAIEKIEVLDNALHLYPHSTIRYTEWRDMIQLSSLFKGANAAPEKGIYIDQRFIDYLTQNQDKLSAMHWRKLEELTAEFFSREGFKVELGPGSNDDGVDVRIWKPSQSILCQPHCLVQCKRQRSKIEKVVVKGLYADVQHEGADYGLIVTTSELSPGAQKTISARGYPLHEINRTGLSEWLTKLQTPAPALSGTK